MQYMEIGGAETSLIGLLQSFDPEKVDVDLFIYDHRGPLMKFIPLDKVNLLPEISSYKMILRPFKEVLLKGHFLIALGKILSNFKIKRYKSIGKADVTCFQFLFDSVTPFLPSLKKKFGHYDLAISFIEPPHIVQDKIDATIKVEWIHTDYSAVTVNTKLIEPRWAANDHIVSIAPTVTEQFLKTYPKLKNKIIEIKNILSDKLIFSRAGNIKPIEYENKSCIIICSVGRICYPKNYDHIPNFCKILRDKGLKFHWFIVGPGEHNDIDEEGKKLGVQDCFTFLGARENPYPYIKFCDIYAHPSRFEGNSVTVREAQILLKPVLIARYFSAPDQVCDGVDGIICEQTDEDTANAIYNLATDNNLRTKLTENLKSLDFTNKSEVNKIYNILDI